MTGPAPVSYTHLSFVLNTSSRISALSTGYLSIFKLVMALSVNVPYVLLDEPVLGLDANHRELFYRILLAKYGEKPFTVVLSTHLIEEVASIIEDVVILKEGKVIRNESREELLSKGYTAVSYTHLDVYKRQVVLQVDGLTPDENGICDVTDRLQSLLDSVKQHDRRGIVLIPEGVYCISRTVYLPRAVRMIGFGKSRPRCV